MKTLIRSVCILLLNTIGYALPVGNPADASILHDGLCLGSSEECCCPSWSLRFGYYGDFVFKHRFQEYGDREGTISRTEIYTNAALLVFNVWNRFDLFSTLGGTRIEIETPVNIVNLSDTIEIETETSFSWSIGLRATLFEWNCLALGLEGQYFSTEPSLKHTQFENSTVNYPDIHAKYREWQIGGGLSYLITSCDCTFGVIPYVAVKYSRAYIDFGDDQVFNLIGLLKVRHQKHWGYAIGFTLFGAQSWSLTLEGRFANESAAHLNVQLRF